MTTAEVVEVAAGIPGWMEPNELAWLATAASLHSRIVEVGSWQGRSTKALALGTPGVVYSVDNLAGEADAPLEDQAGLFQRHLAEELRSRKVRVFNTDSWGLSVAVPKVDMVFIDGSHEYPDPLDDIVSWHASLVPGGLLCGHDRDYPGVRQSLVEAFPDGVEHGPGSIWCVTP